MYQQPAPRSPAAAAEPAGEPGTVIARRELKSATNRGGGYAVWSCRSVSVKPGYQASVVVSEGGGVVEDAGADLQQEMRTASTKVTRVR